MYYNGGVSILISLGCTTFYQRFIISPKLYNPDLRRYRRPSRTRGGGGVPHAAAEGRERDVRYRIKIRSYSVRRRPIAGDLSLFRFFVINGPPGESTRCATRIRFWRLLGQLRRRQPPHDAAERRERAPGDVAGRRARYSARAPLGPFGIHERGALQLTASYARLLAARRRSASSSGALATDARTHVLSRSRRIQGSPWCWPAPRDRSRPQLFSRGQAALRTRARHSRGSRMSICSSSSRTSCGRTR